MKNWEKNVWGFYNFEIPTKLEKTVSWFVSEGQYLEGDICEFGVCYLDEYYSLKFPGAKIAVDEIVSQYKNLKLELMMREPDGFERWHIVNVGNSI